MRTVNRHHHFFQVSPNRPLAVFLWQIEISLKEDLSNQGFQPAAFRLMPSRFLQGNPSNEDDDLTRTHLLCSPATTGG